MSLFLLIKATLEFSRFSDLVPKLRRENEAKCEVAQRVNGCGGENERKFLEIHRVRVKY